MRKHWNKKWLRFKYEEEKLSISEIAKECRVSFMTIARWLDRFGVRNIKSSGISRKGPKAGYWGEVVCPFCSKRFKVG